MSVPVFRIVVTFGPDDYIAASSSYPPQPGEDWERGNDLFDGHGAEAWNRLDALLCWIKANPGRTPEEWKAEVFR